MTKQQYKLCKAIIRYRYVDKIIKNTSLKDYMDLQYQLDYQLDFSDDNMDMHTLVTLKNPLQEEFESRRSKHWKSNMTLFFAGVAAVASLISASPYIGQWLTRLMPQ